jgi:PleD family two-component response regulator
MTISLGVIDFNNERDASEMVQKADAKLYLAKNEGRNLVR